MASTTDKITGVRDGTARPVATTVTSSRSVAGTTLSVGALTGWDTSTKVHFQTYQKDANNEKVDSTATDWSGIVSGTTITNLTLTGGTDSGNSIGDTVECMPTAAWADELAQGLLLEHNPDGTHDATKVAMLAGTQTFTGNKTFSGAVTLPNNSVDANELSTSAITLGYAEITAGNFTTTTTPADVDVTGLSSTVTVPAGGRKVRVTVFISSLLKSGSAGDSLTVKLKEGATQLNETTYNIPGSNFGLLGQCSWIGTPSAGSHTYKVAVAQGTAGTITVTGAATKISYIHVEAI